MMSNERPYFQVKRRCKMLIEDLSWEISVGCDKYKIVGLEGKSAGFRIVNHDGNILAEVRNLIIHEFGY